MIRLAIVMIATMMACAIVIDAVRANPDSAILLLMATSAGLVVGMLVALEFLSGRTP